jgi:hypothetical protein
MLVSIYSNVILRKSLLLGALYRLMGEFSGLAALMYGVMNIYKIPLLNPLAYYFL